MLRRMSYFDINMLFLPHRSLLTPCYARLAVRKLFSQNRLWWTLVAQQHPRVLPLPSNEQFAYEMNLKENGKICQNHGSNRFLIAYTVLTGTLPVPTALSFV